MTDDKLGGQKKSYYHSFLIFSFKNIHIVSSMDFDKDSKIVQKLIKRAFTECDVDKSGHIDAKELHIGLLLFYDKLNAKLPVHMKPPCHDDVKAFLKSHDISQDERLDFQEFSSCVKSMLGMGHRGVFGSLQFQVAKRIAMKMLILPAVVALIKYAAKEGGVKGVGKVPDGVMVIALEGAIKSVKTAAPGLGE